MRLGRLVLLVAWLPGCTEGLLGVAGGDALVRGGVYVDGPVADVTVAALQLEADGSLRLLQKSRSAPATGAYGLDVGNHTGPMLLQAQSGDLGVKLQALVRWPGADKRSAWVSITPVTHLQAAYARYLMSRGHTAEQAIDVSASTFARQFGRVAHAHVVPSFEPTAAVQGAVALGPPHTVGLVVQGLGQLAARYGNVAAGPLLAALAEDIEADGRFDGFGRGGRALRVGNVAIDGDTTRAAWAEGIIAAAEGSPDQQLHRQAVWPLANGMIHSGADLYASVGRAIADAPLGLVLDADLLWCDASGRALVSGTLDRSVRTLRLELQDVGVQTLEALPRGDMEGEQWFAHALPALMLERHYDGIVVARDRYGIQAVQALRIDCRSDAAAHLP